MARRIDVDLNADVSSFEKGIDGAADSAQKLDRQLDNVSGSAKRFDGAMDKTNAGLSNSTEKFRGTADLAGGLGNVLGIEGLAAVEGYATGLADMADGMGTLLAPALAKAKGAFAAMNATLLANPIFIVIALIAALGIAFVIAYKKSETFRKIVHAVFDSVKKAASNFVDAVTGAIRGSARAIARVADIITTPYQIAFRAIASLWNNTVGRLSFSIPGWVPGIGGAGFDVPDIPMLAKGGRATGGMPHIVGERGPELFIPNASGTVVPNSALGGSQVTVVIATGASDLDELIRKRVSVLAGGDVQKAFGSRR